VGTLKDQITLWPATPVWRGLLWAETSNTTGKTLIHSPNNCSQDGGGGVLWGCSYVVVRCNHVLRCDLLFILKSANSFPIARLILYNGKASGEAQTLLLEY